MRSKGFFINNINLHPRRHPFIPLGEEKHTYVHCTCSKVSCLRTPYMYISVTTETRTHTLMTYPPELEFDTLKTIQPHPKHYSCTNDLHWKAEMRITSTLSLCFSLVMSPRHSWMLHSPVCVSTVSVSLTKNPAIVTHC